MDYPDRTLVVTAVDPEDRLGRDVRGKVSWGENLLEDYSTDLRTFAFIWKLKP